MPGYQVPLPGKSRPAPASAFRGQGGYGVVAGSNRASTLVQVSIAPPVSPGALQDNFHLSEEFGNGQQS